MREYLLQIALRKAEVIRERLSETTLQPLREKAREEWIPYKPEPREPESTAGVDGSNNSIEFKGITLYAVLGYALAKRKQGVSEHLVGDIDILYPPGIAERIRLLREIAETKTALLVSDVEVLLIDGSIRSLLIQPRPLARYFVLDRAIDEAVEILGGNVFNEIYERIRRQVDTDPETWQDPFVSKTLVLENNLTTEDTEPLVVLLEYIEKLLSLRLLLEKRMKLDEWPKTIYVSKTSRSQLYFKHLRENLGIPVPSDILVFTYFTSKAGYSKPRLSEEESIKQLPSKAGLRTLLGEFFDKISFIVSYARLEDHGPVLKLEIPVEKKIIGDPSSLTEIVREAVNYISYISVNGYPYTLIEADKSSKITRDDIIRLAHILGLLPRLTGREVLEEWI